MKFHEMKIIKNEKLKIKLKIKAIYFDLLACTIMHLK